MFVFFMKKAPSITNYVVMALARLLKVMIYYHSLYGFASSYSEEHLKQNDTLEPSRGDIIYLIQANVAFFETALRQAGAGASDMKPEGQPSTPSHLCR